MTITVLIENKAPDGLAAEHGLSLHIEYMGKYYLLDTGASNAFAENADVLGISLGPVSTAILSHGHHDHSGGFEEFFHRNESAKVYLRDEAAGLFWSSSSVKNKYIGIPEGLLLKYSERFVYVSSTAELSPGVWVVPHTTPNLCERGRRAHLYLKTDTGIIPDDFSHEHSLVFETEQGLVILNSCSHAGVDNIVSEIIAAFPGKKIAAFIGGFHLMGPEGVSTLGVTPEEVVQLGKKLSCFDIPVLYTGHCTGDPGFSILKGVLGSRINYLSTGTVIEL